MNTPDAQTRIDQILAFQSELKQLEADQVLLLSAANKTVLDNYHQSLLQQFRGAAPLDFSSSARSLSLGMRAFSLVATAALVAFVFLVVEDLWAQFATTGKIILLLSLTFISLAIAAACRARDTYGYYVSIAAVVAAMAFAMNLLGLGKITNSGSTLGYCLAVMVYCWLLGQLFATPLLIWIAAVHLVVAVGLMGKDGFSHSLEQVLETPEKFFIAPLVLLAVYGLERRLGLACSLDRTAIISAWIIFISALIVVLAPENSLLPFSETATAWGYRALALAASTGLIFFSLRRNSIVGVQHGLGLFIVLIWVEFIQHFWDLLPTHLLFFVLGVFAIGCVWLLRKLHKREFSLAQRGRG